MNHRNKGHSKNGVFAPFTTDEMGRLVRPSQNSIRTPVLNMWAGYNRVQPMTSVSPGVLASQEVDFQYGANLARGYLSELFAEVTITENNTGPSQFIPYNLWNHTDIVTSDGKIFKQIWPDEMWYANMIYRDYQEQQRIHNVEGIQLGYTPNSPTVAQNTSQQFILKIPVFKELLCDFRLLRAPFILRFYFNKASDIVMSGSSANISLTTFNLLTKEVLLPSIRPSKCLTFKYAGWTRNVQPLAISPNNDYDIKLNTFTGYAKYLFFMIRSNPTSSNADNLFNTTPGQYLSTYELRDSGNNIIGVSVNVQESKYIFSQEFNSDYLIQPNTYVHVINFAMDGNTDQNLSTHTGGYQFTSNEFLHLRTSASMPAATYEITIWQVAHESFNIHPNGEFTFTK